MKTENLSTTQEIFYGINKIVKLSYEDQFKLLLSLVLSTNERYVSDAKSILFTKCKELEKEGKADQLSQSTIQTILLLFDSFAENQAESFDFFNMFQSTVNQCNDELKQISDIEMSLGLSTEDSVDIEKIYLDLGPFMINNMISCADNIVLSSKLDEKRLATFIMHVTKHQNWVEDKESAYLNKVFLKSMESEDYKFIDESGDKKTITWNIDNFYRMFQDCIDKMNPETLFSYFDCPSFSIKDKKKFDFFISTLQKLKLLTNPNQIFTLIFNKWTNELNQIEFLQFLINTPQTDYFSFKSYTGEKVQINFELSSNITKSSNNYLIEPWSCVALIKVLLKLSSGNYYVKVKQLFSWPIQNIPEIIVMGLIAIKPESEDFLYDELIQEVLTLFLGNHMNSFAVIEEVWNNNNKLIIRTIANMYNSSPDLMNLSRILDITQKLKDSLLLLVNCDDYKFAVNLAILAVKRDFLHIEQWLKDRIEKVGDDFINALLTYIKDNLIAHCRASTTRKENILEKSQLSLESLAVIFENLVNAKHANNPKVSQETEEEIKEVYKSIFEIFDELQLQPVNSEEIEQTANSIFQYMFKGETTVFETIQKLNEYKESQDQKEREIYACMIHCLLDEYRFYHQYPEKQLTTISTLFGQIINNSLIDGVIETIALKYILEGIKKGSGPMFVFGTTALQQFLDKLCELPSYLKNLIEQPQLKNNPVLYERVLEIYNQDMLGGANPMQKQENTRIEIPQNFQQQIPPGNQQMKMNQPYSQNMMGFEDLNEREKKMMKLNTPQGKDFYTNMPIGIREKPQKEVQPFYMVNPMNITSFQPVPNMQNMNMGTLAGLNPNMGQQIDEEKGFKGFGNVFDLGIPNMGARDNNTPGMLNQSGNFGSMNNMNIGGELKNLSPKRQNRTKVARQQSGSIGEVIGLEAEKVPPPSQDIIENMIMIFNSMSKSNVREKSIELKAILNNDNIIKWFSAFFISKRIIVESNNHQIYNDLITQIDLKELNQYLIQDTIYYINKLLQSDKIDKDPKEKSILKNLGSWLGIMTLARNKPILARDLDLKETILDAYKKGKLSAIVLFVSKILEHCAKTTVFHSKNPWLQAILTLLNELNSKPNLQKNLTFEIDNLFKKLDIDQTTYPKNKLLERLTLPPNSPDFVKYTQSQQPEERIEQVNRNELFNKINQADYYLMDLLSTLNSHSQIVISKPDLIKMLHQVLYNSIMEIIGPVVERAVNISLVTTKELIIKDFLFDMDEEKFITSAANCIESLAGSLALVTCKEPLRIGYSNKLKDMLSSRGFDSNSIEFIITSNQGSQLLDIGCNYIHNFVIKKAIEKIQNDEDIKKEIHRRQMGISVEMNRPLNPLVSKILKLPEIIRPSLSGLTKEQFQIYKNYSEIHKSFTKFEQSSKNSKISMIIKMLKEVLESVNNNPMKITKNYEVCMVNIQNILYEVSNTFTEGSDELNVLEKCITKFNADNVIIKKELAQISLKYALIAIRRKNLNLLNIYSSFIKGWTTLNEEISKVITSELFNFTEIDIRFNPDLHICFIKKKIIDTQRYEDNILDCLESLVIRPFCIKLLRELKKQNLLTSFVKVKPFMLEQEQCEIYFSLFSKKNRLPSKINFHKEAIIDYKICNIKDIATYGKFSNMCSYAFNKIVSCIIPPSQANKYENLEKDLKDFLNSAFISSEEQLNVFIMIITEFCVTRGEKENEAHNYYPENEAHAIFALLHVVPPSIHKIHMFSNILLGIFKTFHYDYVKSNVNFNQRTYYRLFFTFIHLLSQYKNSDTILNSQYKKIDYLIVLCEFFKILSPVNYPGFALAWLDLISCKSFIASFLEPEGRMKDNFNIAKFEKYLYLIIDLFTYLKSNSENVLQEFNSKAFLDNVFKFIFLLCNSFPEFISSYYYIIIVSFQSGNCFNQLKNLILSCGPKDVERPDPFADDFKESELPERKKTTILFDIASILKDYGYKGYIDKYIELKYDSVVDELSKKLNSVKKRDLNLYVINAIVIYWAQRITKLLQEKEIRIQEFIGFFLKLLQSVDHENRDHLINSLLNELRFPSYQTDLFSFLILQILVEVKNETIEEHLMRNMLERLMYRPTPWGLIYCFVRVLKNYQLTRTGYFMKNGGIELFLKVLYYLKPEKVKKLLGPH